MLFGIVGTLVLAVACVRLVSWFVGFVFGDGSDAVDKKLAVADARRRRYRAQIISLTFRALKSIAMADGHFHESERDCLASCAKALAVKCPNLDEIPTITPRALAKSLVGQEPEKCALIITLMCHFSLIDGEEHPDEFKLVEKFAQEFDVERKTLIELRSSVMTNHERSEEALRKSRRPDLSRKSNAVLLYSQDFYKTLERLCHR